MPGIDLPARRHRGTLRTSLSCALVIVCTAIAAPLAAQKASGDYATDLGVVYAGYQRILALKEACDEAVAETRAANARAFSKWQSRHANLLAELKRRVTAMIRRASTSEQDFTRKLGKYEGAILLSREEQKITFLTEGADTLKARCQRVPELLGSAEGDLAAVFSSELETIRKQK